MVGIETKELNIGIELKRKIEMICRFNNPNTWFARLSNTSCIPFTIVLIKTV